MKEDVEGGGAGERIGGWGEGVVRAWGGKGGRELGSQGGPM